MGQEFRTIILTHNELAEAVDGYLDEDSDSLAGDNVEDIAYASGADVCMEVTLKAPLVDGRRSITLNHEALISAIIKYCQQKAVPLPRRGAKHLERRLDGISLMIEVDWF